MCSSSLSFFLVCVCVQEMAEVTATIVPPLPQGAPPTSATPTLSVPSAGMVIYVVGKPFTFTRSHDHVG